MKKILILAKSSGGLYDFRNELVERLLSENEVLASLPDEVRTKELEEEGIQLEDFYMEMIGEVKHE